MPPPGSIVAGIVFLSLAAAPAQAQGFVERAEAVGLEHEVLSGWDDFGTPPVAVRDWTQTGLALGDIDGDGRLDVVCAGGPLPNRVFLQQPDGSFQEHATAGIRSGELDRVPALGDYDRDGDLDLFIGAMQGGTTGATLGQSRLYDNDGTGTFEDVTGRSGTSGSGRTLHAQWADTNLDGWLDLYLSEFLLTPNLLYRNNGDLSFTEVTDLTGAADDGSAHASSIFDADGNGWPDVFVGNDHLVGKVIGVPNFLNEGDGHYSGDGDGMFTDVTALSGFGQERGIMGLAFGDVDYDGELDVYKTDVGANWLLANRGWPSSGMPWEDVTSAYGVADALVPFLDQPDESGPTSGWATMFLDVDLDSFVDLFVVNGHVAGVNPEGVYLPRLQPNSLYRGLGPGSNHSFELATESFGLFDRYDDRAGAMGDVDGDGDMDLLVMETAGRLRYFENQVDRQGRGTLSVRVESNTSAAQGIGSVVRYVASDGLPRVRAIGIDAPTAGQNEALAHFGLGSDDDLTVEVALPSGVVLSQSGVAPDSDLVFVEPTMIVLDTTVVGATNAGVDTLPSEVQVTAYPHDAQGQPLLGSPNVQIQVAGLQPIGGMSQNGGAYVQRFAAPPAPGQHRVTVEFDGWQPSISPIVHAVGRANAAETLVRVDTLGLRAGSRDTIRIEVSPRDANGVALGGGRAVGIDLLGADALGPVEDFDDGRYARSFYAPAITGVQTPSVVVDGVNVSGIPAIECGGVADPIQTEVHVFEPRFLHSASQKTVKFEVVPRDAGGWLLGGDRNVKLVVEWADGAVVRGPVSGGGPATGAPQSSAGAGVAPKAPLRRSDARIRVVEGFETLRRAGGSYLFAVERGESSTLETRGLADVWIDGVLVVEGLPFGFDF